MATSMPCGDNPGSFDLQALRTDGILSRSQIVHRCTQMKHARVHEYPQITRITQIIKNERANSRAQAKGSVIQTVRRNPAGIAGGTGKRRGVSGADS